MRILLARTDRVGDLILSTPAIASVRRSFPGAHVTLACSRYNSVVVDRSPDVDELAIVPTEVKPAAFGARFRGVDLAIALAPRDADHRIVAATDAPVRVGYTYARRYAARLMLRTMLTRVVISQADPATAERHPERVVAHEVDQVLAVAAAGGAHTLAHELVLPVIDEDRAAVAGLPERPIVVQLGRRWTEQGSTTASCVQLFRDLRALGRPVIATFGDDALALGETVARAGVADAVLGGLAFHVWAAIFERAACVVTIDTGATHVASAVHAPTVVLFERKWFRLASQEWSPYRVPNAILRKPPDESDASLRASRAEIAAAVASLLCFDKLRVTQSRISVVVPTYNRLDTLRHVIPSLLAQDLRRGEFEVVVADSNSTDGTAEYLADVAKNAPFVRHLPGPYTGRASARNAGIAAAQGRIVLFTDADIIASPDLLSRHLAHHEAPGVRAIVGMEVQVDSYEDYLQKRGDRAKRTPLHGEKPKKLSWLYFLTGNASVARAELDRVGRFDEDFTGYGHEDLELGYRLQHAGVPIAYEPQAVNYHWHPVPWREQQQKYELAGKSTVRFFRKHPAFDVRLRLGMTPLSLTLHGVVERVPAVKSWIENGASAPGLARTLSYQYHYLTGVKAALRG